VPAVALPIAKKRPAGIRALVDWLAAHRPDVVSTHSSTDAWLTALSLLAMGRPFPMVRTRHDSVPVPRNPAARWLHVRAAGRIVTTGEILKRELVERNRYPALRIDSVPTGMDPQRFRPGDRGEARRRLGLAQDRTLVGIVSGLRRSKGHRYLIEALAGLPAAVDLVIVGDGPERAPLEAQVAQLGLGARVRFAGHQRDVLPWLHAFDAFALPCCADEGVPQALIQAMLAGLACVTTSNGGIPEIAKDGETALVVPPRQSAALREALSKILSDPSLAGRLGPAARAYCEPRYSSERMLDEMERIYALACVRPARLTFP
jgi:glycosyltransferase involved in cell wall biosynthesis